MLGHSTYLFWLWVFIWMPTGVIWLTNLPLMLRYWRLPLRAAVWALLFGVPYDYVAIRTDIWHFPPEHVLGVWIIGLPLEEHLFIATVTFYVACVALCMRAWMRQAR